MVYVENFANLQRRRQCDEEPYKCLVVQRLTIAPEPLIIRGWCLTLVSLILYSNKHLRRLCDVYGLM